MSNDLLLVNGTFHTMAARAPRAAAVAIRDGRFLHVGDQDGARAALSGSRAEVVDLGGRCALPGLTDSHLHFLWYAEALDDVDAETPTREEALSRVQERASRSEPGAWIRGSGWNHNVWGDGALPDATSLDRAAPRNPVIMEAKSRHAVWVNSLALRSAGIGLDTPDPEGGKIVHGRDGLPTGVLLENAMRLVQDVVPPRGSHEIARLVLRAQEEAHRRGLTGIHDFGDMRAFEAFQALHGRGDLALRVTKGIPHAELARALSLRLASGFGNEMLVLGPVKMFADGALGPQTAWMLAPYEGTWATGIPTLSEEQLREDIARANAGGLACAVHAIGDAACHVVLSAFEKAFERAGAEARRLRNRIEHVQLLHPDDLGRLARLGIIASMQPLHATSDMLMAERAWGARCATAYAWRSLLDAGTSLALGSDCPVEIPDPLAGIHAAVTRRRADGSPGEEGWYPRQRLSVAQAVHGYTLGAAYACGREAELGSMETGKLADLTVLEKDIFSIADVQEIRSVSVDATIVGGRFVRRGF